MGRKQPLYPHVSKGRPKKTSNAWRCKECGWTTWNITECPRCGSRDLEELTMEELSQSFRTGQPVIHPRSEEPPLLEKIVSHDWAYVGTCIGSARSDLESAIDTLNTYPVVKGVSKLIDNLQRIDAELNTLYERGLNG